MYQDVSLNDFQNWFANSGGYENNFSYEGQEALYNYLEEYEDSTGEKVEFDPIALCCEYSEFATALECGKNYGEFESLNTCPVCGEDILPYTTKCPDCEQDITEDQEKNALNWLEENTQVIVFDKGIIISEF